MTVPANILALLCAPEDAYAENLESERTALLALGAEIDEAPGEPPAEEVRLPDDEPWTEPGDPRAVHEALEEAGRVMGTAASATPVLESISPALCEIGKEYLVDCEDGHKPYRMTLRERVRDTFKFTDALGGKADLDLTGKVFHVPGDHVTDHVAKILTGSTDEKSEKGTAPPVPDAPADDSDTPDARTSDTPAAVRAGNCAGSGKIITSRTKKVTCPDCGLERPVPRALHKGGGPVEIAFPGHRPKLVEVPPPVTTVTAVVPPLPDAATTVTIAPAGARADEQTEGYTRAIHEHEEESRGEVPPLVEGVAEALPGEEEKVHITPPSPDAPYEHEKIQYSKCTTCGGTSGTAWFGRHPTAPCKWHDGRKGCYSDRGAHVCATCYDASVGNNGAVLTAREVDVVSALFREHAGRLPLVALSTEALGALVKLRLVQP